MKKLIWIVNPSSRPRRIKKYRAAIEGMLGENGFDVETVLTEKAGDPERLARERKEEAHSILVAGGDGTIREVLTALKGEGVPVGFIPLGTANVLARELGIPLEPIAAAQAFLKGVPREYDMGMLGNQAFLIMASYGFDAFVVGRVSLFLKKFLGRGAYALAGILGLAAFRPEPIEIFIEEGSPPIVATFVVFANASRYAGDYVVAPDAQMNDGFIDLVCWTKPGRLGSASGFVSLFTKKIYKSPHVKILQARRVRFRTKKPEWFQVDGDPADGGEGTVEVLPRAVRIITP